MCYRSGLRETDGGMIVDSSWPSHVKEFRQHQVDACEQIVARFNEGCDVVLLDAPVGSGKTIIAEMVRRELGIRKSSYVCSGKELQDQFLREFDYARVLKGRANYPTHNRPDYTAADCLGKTCNWCEPRNECGYLVAKREAIKGDVAVLNTSYLLSFPGNLFFRDLMVVDEADLIESAMLSHYEFGLSAAKLALLDLQAPKKGVHQGTIVKWLEEVRDASREAAAVAADRLEISNGEDVEAVKDLNYWTDVVAKCELVIDQWPRGLPWVREYEYMKEGNFKLKPVEMSEQGAGLLWDRGRDSETGRPKSKWLCMSGTIIDAGMRAQSWGLEKSGLTWDVVSVPMLWDKKYRPIMVNTVANMKRAEIEKSFPVVMAEMVKICKRHQGENILVHSVSYPLMRNIVAWLRREGFKDVISYEGARDRALALQRFKGQGGIMVAPSMDRGVDLPGDMCGVQIVAKVPYPSLGDPQIRERMELEGGARWYAMQTAATLMQMSGRGVRFDGDKCALYVLDSGFDNWWRQWYGLLPRWWRDGIIGDLPEGWGE